MGNVLFAFLPFCEEDIHFASIGCTDHESTWHPDTTGREGGRQPIQILLTFVFVLLLLNFAVAMGVLLRRRESRSWLLILLLSNTTGVALAAVSGLLWGIEISGAVDVSAVFAGLAAVSAVVAVVAYRQRGGAP